MGKFLFSSAWRDRIGLLALLVLAVGLYLSLVRTPPDYYQGEVARIMNLHVPLVKTSLLAYFVAFVASILFLWKRRDEYDVLAHASVAVGAVFTLCALLSGAIWGKPTWNAWWTWDARLVSFAILFLLMAGYLMLRAFIEDADKQARAAAVFALVGFVDLPIIHLSVQWWRTLHQPASFSAKGLSISPDMMLALASMAIGMSLLYAYLTLLYAQLIHNRSLFQAVQEHKLREAHL
ncbi:MAG: cytochrome c biogenesis protein CcsA [Sulfuricellaceae bacterium]|nr:cytochrome c biogenesis protein CcsA [Sulfuricellaceae bacterium]